VSNLCGVVILIIQGGFYSSKLHTIPLPLTPIEQGLIFFSSRVPGLFWYETLGLLILFVFLEVGVYGMLISVNRRYFSLKEWNVFMTTMLFLALLPFFRYGHYNDLVMRASIPGLFMLCILVMRNLYNSSPKKKGVLILFIALMVGAITPFTELKNHISEIYKTGTLFQTPQSGDLYTVLNTTTSPSLFSQYVGSSETPFFRCIAKRVDIPEPAVSTPTKNTY
jgi:hypothetical protein